MGNLRPANKEPFFAKPRFSFSVSFTCAGAGRVVVKSVFVKSASDAFHELPSTPLVGNNVFGLFLPPSPLLVLSDPQSDRLNDTDPNTPSLLVDVSPPATEESEPRCLSVDAVRNVYVVKSICVERRLAEVARDTAASSATTRTAAENRVSR
ncbi:hypothetical protein HDU96_000738 [Phlyctochytrium bullatum]|nr:hypothetical protein HDU96_000738 [Phlyctochytrium bullatum]